MTPPFVVHRKLWCPFFPAYASAFKFLLTAIDADINLKDAFAIDRFRIKIWYEENGIENVVYDNGLNAGDDVDLATTELEGGSIKIHTK